MEEGIQLSNKDEELGQIIDLLCDIYHITEQIS